MQLCLDCSGVCATGNRAFELTNPRLRFANWCNLALIFWFRSLKRLLSCSGVFYMCGAVLHRLGCTPSMIGTFPRCSFVTRSEPSDSARLNCKRNSEQLNTGFTPSGQGQLA